MNETLMGTTCEIKKKISQAIIRIKIPTVDRSICTGCGTCSRACPHMAIFFDRNLTANINSDQCRSCGICIPACPVKAITQ